MLRKSLRAIAAIFVAMAIGATVTTATHAYDGVSVNENTCQVGSVSYSVSPSSETRQLAGVYVDKIPKGRCYAIVIHKIDGNQISMTITWGPHRDKIGFTRQCSAIVYNKKFACTVDPIFGIVTTYRGSILGPWRIRLEYSNQQGAGRLIPRNVTPYAGETQ